MTIKLQEHQLGGTYAGATTLEEVGAIMYAEDVGSECVLSDEHDALQLELGDYLDEVLDDPTEEDKRRVLDGYRAARDGLVTTEQYAANHSLVSITEHKTEAEMQAALDEFTPDEHPSTWGSFSNPPRVTKGT